MYKYLELEKHKEEQEIKNSFLPTIQLKMKSRNIQCIRDAKFINKVISNFYEKPELFEDTDFKARVKLMDMLDFMKDDSCLLRENLPLEDRLKNFKYCYEYFKKKKYIAIQTEEGKIARKNNLASAYIVLTDLGIKEFLNLEKKDLSKQLNPFVEKYINKYSFVAEENKKYIFDDYKKIKVEMTNIFDNNEHIFLSMYKKYYENVKKIILKLITLSGKDAIEFKNKILDDEIHYIIRKTTTRNIYEGTYSLNEEDYTLDEYLNQIISNRIELDRDEFVSKQSLKVGSILKGRSYTVENPQLNEGLESLLHFTLEDGAKFTVLTQIVESISSNGNFFIRKPTTFHDVYYADGRKLMGASYEKLVKEL